MSAGHDAATGDGGRDEPGDRTVSAPAEGDAPAARERPVEPAELDPEVAAWLVSHAGTVAVAEVTAALDDGVAELALATSLRGEHPVERATALLQLASTRRRARRRWADADRLLFTRGGLEQASDPTVAAWRAARFADAHVVDLGCGLGGDLLALAARAETARGVDLDASRTALAGHNLSVGVPHVHVDVEVADAFDVAIAAGTCAHADPARRIGDRRVFDPARTRPAVDALLHHLRPADGAGIVLAPGVDADHPALRATGDGLDVEVEYVQLGPDLVEAVLWTGALASAVRDARTSDVRGAARGGAAFATATLLAAPADPARPSDPVPAVVQRRRHRPWSEAAAEAAAARCTPVGDWLVELAPAAVRARLVDELAAELDLARLAHHRALLTGALAPDSPWCRSREVLAVLDARPAAVKRWLRGRDVPAVELVAHGVAMDVPARWRELGRPPRGPDGWRLEFVRRDHDTVVIVTDASTTGSGW